MNNTKNILLIALITATLVLGTSVITMQSYAGKDNNDEHKKGKDFSKIIASSESDKKSASQHMDQDNVCYRGDDCQQANQGQQIVGKDNDAKGFNDQSKNAQASLGAQPTETPTNEPTPSVTPEVTPSVTPEVTPSVTPDVIPCATCFANAFATAPTPLTTAQIQVIVQALGGNGASIPSVCNLGTISGTVLTAQLLAVGISQANINILIQCLQLAGITVTFVPTI